MLSTIETSLLAAPDDDEFHRPDDPKAYLDFLPSPAIEAMAKRLIDREDIHFRHLASLDIAYLWKRKGGASGGKVVFGKCVKAAGLIGYFGQVEFVVWLAADHCRGGYLTARQFEAMVFHELCHIGLDAETGKVGAVAHEFEGFTAEIDRYGLWQDELQAVGKSIRQLSLFEGEA